EINSYIASGDPFDKAGGYGIQGLAGQFVEKVEGSYSGVIGLPVDETKALLAEIGIRPH
ncbi:Maf family protein, partial [Parasutterella excrementihominis]